MYKLEITSKLYKTILIGLITCAIPSIFLVLYGVELLNYDSNVLGFIILLTGLSGTLVSLNSLFILIECSSSDYDWSKHAEFTDNECILIKNKPFIVNKIYFKDLKQINVKNNDKEIEVTFVTGEYEIKCNFTEESYDTILFFKKKYIIGW